MHGANSAAERDKADRDMQAELASMAKCPDYIVNRGHYFGTDQFTGEPGLSDQDKEELIAFLKTL